MKKIDIDELRRIQIDILDELVSFCRQKGLRYFLSDGTLLGAIRHKGFIPWDDDIDVGMLREDYDEFVSTFNNNRPADYPYRLRSLDKEKDFMVAFAKLEDTRTKIVEDLDDFVDIGVNVDIFPYDAIPDNPKEYLPLVKRALRLRRIIDFKKVRSEAKRVWYRNLVLEIGKFILKPIPLSFFLRRLDKLARSQNGASADSNLIYSFPGSFRRLDCVIPRKCFDEFIDVDFEDKKYLTLVGYDTYLKLYYGDYMTLPPEEKRKRHNPKAWWK